MEERTFRRRLAAITAAGAAWRLGVLVVDKWRQPLLLNDSIYYSGQAVQLARGTWFREIFVDQPGAEHGPLTSTLLAVVSWVDQPLPWQRLVTVLCGIATVALLGLLGRAVGGARAGLAAAAIAAAYPNLWMNDGLVMSESVSVLAVVATLLAAVRCVELTRAHADPADPDGTGAREAPPGERWAARRPVRAAVLVGVLAGAGTLARSELALLVPGVALVVLLSRPRWWRGALVVVAAAGAVVAPWVMFNLARFERPVTLTTNDGTTLLGSYCDAAFHGPNTGGWSLLCVVADPDYAVDEEPSVRSARQRDLALEYARDHVRELPRVVLARLGRTLDLYGLDSLVAQDVGEERYRWASWAGIAGWWVLAPLAVAGFVRHRRLHLDADSARVRLLLLLPCLAVLVTTATFYGGHRIRSSMEPTVVVLAALGAVAAWERWRR